MTGLDPMRPWSIAECAEYLGVSVSHFHNAVRYAEGFPEPLEPYSYVLAGKKRQSAPQWAGIDVMRWRLGGRFEQITPYLRNDSLTT